jgi:outer membrane lipoprotein SlyB
MLPLKAPGSSRTDAALRLIPIGALTILTACTTIGPTAQVLPGPGKTFEQFTADQQACTAYTDAQIRPLADENSKQQLGALALGTLLGAGLGAGLGGAIGGGHGAGIGAAAGAIGGTAVGAGTAGASDPVQRLQLMYDNTYVACMVARGHRPPAVIVPQTVVVAPPAVVVQPAPYVVQPAPYVVQPAAPAGATP